MTSSRKKITEEDKKAYEEYLADSEPAIQQMKDQLGPDAEKLDYTPESLKYVDELIKQVVRPAVPEDSIFGMPERRLTEEETWWTVRLGYYVAEVALRNLGAKWVMDKRTRRKTFGMAVLSIGLYTVLQPMELVFSVGRNKQSIYSWYSHMEKECKE